MPDEIKTRADFSPDVPPPPSRPGTLPPAAKTIAVVFAGLERMGKELGLPILCLLAGKWDIFTKEQCIYAFLSATGVVLGGNFALRKAENHERT